ncbi:MAG: ROK family protein [Holdemanella sp.]|nr:ROK family protein [Holdemanella sp.]
MKVLVIDIGGTFIKYAIMKEDNTILEKGKVPTPQDTKENLIDSIANLYEMYKPVDGIAISMPGIIDVEKGLCLMGGALSYNNNHYLRDALYKRCPVKITMDNDAKCAATAEAMSGALSDVKNGIVIILGTMIGGGIVIDHKVVRGSHFSTGEVSYIISDKNANPTRETVWGNRCGVPSLCNRYAQLKGLNPEDVDGVLVFNAANNKEPEGVQALQEYTKEVAVQIWNLQTILDPEKVAIGGGISSQPILLEYIAKHLETMSNGCPYKTPKTQLVKCAFENDANLIGALQYFLIA